MYEFVVSKYLPKTIKDKDGKEHEVIGMAVDKKAYDQWMLDMPLLGDEQPAPPPIYIITGDVKAEPVQYSHDHA